MGDYTGKRYRRMRQQFLDECRRNRTPCSICRQPINYDLRWPNEWAPELHHIEPSSTHPHLHYVRANHAPAHSRCNKGQSNNPATTGWVQPTW